MDWGPGLDHKRESETQHELALSGTERVWSATWGVVGKTPFPCGDRPLHLLL